MVKSGGLSCRVIVLVALVAICCDRTFAAESSPAEVDQLVAEPVVSVTKNGGAVAEPIVEVPDASESSEESINDGEEDGELPKKM